jgi:hypothetical protein
VLAIHFICRRDDGVSLRNLQFDKMTKRYLSGKWDVTIEDSQSLVGGWIYLRATKTAPSEFGGIIRGFEPITDTSYTHPERIIFHVDSRLEGKGQRWRGHFHSMAHTSDVVETTYPREKKGN